MLLRENREGLLAAPLDRGKGYWVVATAAVLYYPGTRIRTRMNQRLSWNSLREAFKGQWVEITDYHWESNSPYPKWARVGRFASDRETLLSALREAESDDALILFVGSVGSVIR
jgi:hypothetical protein